MQPLDGGSHVVFTGIVTLLIAGAAQTQTTRSSDAPPGASRQAAGHETVATRPADPERDYYVRPRAVSAVPDTTPPSYVKTVDQFGWPGTADLGWLEFGAEQRTRLGRYDDDYRFDLGNDTRFYSRSRGYVGVREAFDPFRFGIEFLDARLFGDEFAEEAQFNFHEFSQAFGELHFADAFGEGRPARFIAGRVTLDDVDRKLVSRTTWNNTPASFDGFRIQLGDRHAPWALDLFAVQPVQRRQRRPDHPDEERWFYGLIGTWRKWSKIVTIEPYYFILDRDARYDSDRELHTLGLRAYGVAGKTGLDWDVDTAFQFGNDGDRSQQAFAANSEVGYLFDLPYRPRAAAILSYATGDRNPDDGVNGRFNRLFGTSDQYSIFETMEWSNIIQTAIRLQLRPSDKIRLEGYYRAHWLASRTDAWPRTSRRDPEGNSGRFIGHTLETFIQYDPNDLLSIRAGYAHFFPGPFPRETGPADDSDFFYVQTILQLDRWPGAS